MLDSTGVALDVLPLGRQADQSREADVLVLGPEHRVADEPASPQKGAMLMNLLEFPKRPAPASGPLLDEGALRELVAHMVRDELNRSFGERLTRQIRTLVRREVTRLVGGRNAD